MKRQLRLCLFLFLCLLSNEIPAQEKPFAFNLVTGSKDVSLGKITGITQDTWGYMWFLDQGNHQLVRYDGYRMNVFKHNPADSNSINANDFECFAADSSGNIWLPVLTGIDKLNSTTGNVTHYKLKNPMADAIMVDHLGIIWVGGSSGLYQLNPETGKTIYYFHNDNDSTTLSSGAVRVLYEDKEGTIWAGNGYPFAPGNDGGLNKLNRATGKFTRYVNNPADPQSIINNRVRSILEDSRGTFWIGTQGDGLQIMDRKTGKFQRLTYDANHPEKLSRPKIKKGDDADHITFIKEDNSGSIWIGTYHEGIVRYDPATKKINHFFKDTTNVNGFPESTTWTAFVSRDGTLWVATENSFLLYRVDAFRKSITHISTVAIANSFVEDKDGYLWAGTSGNGLFKFDQHYNVSAHFVHIPLDSLSLPDNNSMISVMPDDNNIWSGNFNGMRMIDAHTNKFYKVNIKNSLFKDSAQHGFVGALKDNNGITWFTSWGNGLLKYDPEDGSVKQFLPDPKDPASINSNNLNHLLEDRQGRLWIIGQDGVNRMDRTTSKFKHYIPGTFVVSIYQDSRNNIWAGSVKGLFKYNERSDSFSSFFDPLTDISELPVGGIVEDNNHNLWLTSSSSIVKLNPFTKEFFIYGDKFGIGKNSIDIWNKTLKNSRGQLCIGNGDGFSVFYPRDLEEKKDFKILITNFLINNIPVYPGKQSPIEKPIEELNNVNLPYNQNNIAFNFSAMDYRDPESISYFTMLEGYDTTWRKVIDDKNSHYFNLPVGKFVYHIKAFNRDGEKAEKVISIIVNPPWWQTWWAYTLYVLLLVGSIWGYIRWRTRTLEKEKTVLEKRVMERTSELKKEKEIVESTLSELKSTQAQLIQSEKMASLGELTAGIAHEIQNPLNFVNNFSEVSNELIDEMKEELNKGAIDEAKAIAEEVKQNLEKINHHGKRAGDIVKGMLQHSRTSKGVKETTNMNALADEYLRLSYHGLRAKDKSFNAGVKTDFDEGVGNINIIPQDIGRVLLNLLNNAFYAVTEKKNQQPEVPTTGKAGYEPLVSVSTKKINGKVEISVKDNGNGIPKKVLDKIFQPFFTTKPTGQGTGLGLSLSYDIIKAHGGEIKVNTVEGEFTEFVVHLPISI